MSDRDGRRPGGRRLFFGSLLALGTGVTAWSFRWCSTLEVPEECINVYPLFCVPLAVVGLVGLLLTYRR